MYRVLCYLWFQAPPGGLGTYTLQIKEDYSTLPLSNEDRGSERWSDSLVVTQLGKGELKTGSSEGV